MKTDAVICIAFISTRPSFIPLSLKHSSTFEVILIKALLVGTLNHNSCRYDFISPLPAKKFLP
jgi:hypothetical protein